jgi:ComEC/Rec2-related protein
LHRLKFLYRMSSFYFHTKHLAFMVIALIAGITFAYAGLLGLFIFLGCLALTYHEEHKPVVVALMCCFFFFGSTRYYQHQAAFFADNDLLEKNCNVTAIVQEIFPRLDEQEQICIALHISDIQINQKAHSVDKKIYLFLPHYTKLWIKPYQKIAVNNIILKHPNSTSYQEYLIRENVWAVAHPKWLSYTTIKKSSLFMQQIDQLCAMPLQATNHAISQLTHSLYLSIFCGKKIKSTTTKMKELFSYWGISHHLARSGLHLIILIGLLLFLLSCIPCAASKKQWIAAVLLIFYYATTYPSVAFMRAFYMYLLYTLCKQLYVPSSSVHILLITTLLTLVINPSHLFFLDFQLSFSITLLILWFCQVSQNRKTVAL